MSRGKHLAEKLAAEHTLQEKELLELLEILRAETAAGESETAALLAERADQTRRQYYGNKVFVRGLIEISNICRNDCRLSSVSAKVSDPEAASV